MSAPERAEDTWGHHGTGEPAPSPRVFGEAIHRTLTVISLVLVSAVSIAFADTDTDTSNVIIDHVTYDITLEEMRSGAGFYEAFDQGFVQTYGDSPPSARDVRLPTLFLVLSQFPAQGEWIIYILSSALAGLWVGWRGSVPLVGPAITLYLLNLGVTGEGEAALAQYLYVELWAAPWFVIAVVELMRGNRRWWVAAGFVAFLLREQGALLLIGALAGAGYRRTRELPHAVAALGVATVLYTGHVVTALRFVDPDGIHTPLNLGWPPLESMIRMAGFDLPAVVGVALWLAAIAGTSRRSLTVELLPLLALPLTGLYANRPYWGIMFVPVALILAADSLGWFTDPERQLMRQARASDT